MKILLFPLLAFSTIFLASCTSNSNKIGTQKVSETQRQREVCLDWYGYRIDTKKAINDLNLNLDLRPQNLDIKTYCNIASKYDSKKIN